MPLPRELNPSNPERISSGSFRRNLEHRASLATGEESAGMNLQERITELEARNLYLQSLVVELLDKNEQLRRKVRQQENLSDASSNQRS